MGAEFIKLIEGEMFVRRKQDEAETVIRSTETRELKETVQQLSKSVTDADMQMEDVASIVSRAVEVGEAVACKQKQHDEQLQHLHLMQSHEQEKRCASTSDFYKRL